MYKGEIARYEQFLLFPQCFQKACFPETSKCVIVWEIYIFFQFYESKLLMICIVFSYKFQWYIYCSIRRDVKNLNSHL